VLNPAPETVLDAERVVNAPVLGVVAPTVPLMLIEAVPVKLVTTPLAGVPKLGVTNVGESDITTLPVPVIALLVSPLEASVKTAREAVNPVIIGLFTNVATCAELMVMALVVPLV